MCRCAGRNQQPFVADGLKGIFAAYEAEIHALKCLVHQCRYLKVGRPPYDGPLALILKLLPVEGFSFASLRFQRLEEAVLLLGADISLGEDGRHGHA